MSKVSARQLRYLEKHTICCNDVERLMGEFVDNDLTPSLRDRINDHVKCCSTCCASLRGYREVISLASALRDQPLPAGVGSRLRSALNAKLGLNLSTAE